MIRIVEAVVEVDGRVRLLERVEVSGARRAVVTILDESADESRNADALLSEAALEDWNRAEEDETWSHLQRAQA
jgi:hypothetical protein